MFYPADLLCQNTKCTSSGVMLKNTRWHPSGIQQLTDQKW